MKSVHNLGCGRIRVVGATSLAVTLFLSGGYSASAQVDSIPADWAYPVDSGATGEEGFTGSVHQARDNASLSATIARGDAQLDGTLIDPLTEEPYANLAVTTDDDAAGSGWWYGTPVNPDFTFEEDGVINYSAETGWGDAAIPGFGNFTGDNGYEDANFPGLPGRITDDPSDPAYEDYFNAGDFAIELLGYIQLTAGEHVLGVFHDDAFQLAIHPHDARDIFRQPIVQYDSNSGQADRTATVQVAADGLYSVRLLLAQWQDNAMLELYSAPGDDPEAILLVNDPDENDSLKVWRELSTPSRPYVSSVMPARGASGVGGDTSVEAVFVNLGDEDPVMRINGTEVEYTKQTDGDQTTILHTPETAFTSGQTVAVDLEYGIASGQWEFVVETGNEALLITGGGQLNGSDGWIANRLASVFGLDVQVVSDDAVSLSDGEGKLLVINSSTVNSGKVAGANFEELPIALMNVESANVDDFLLGDSPYQFGNNPTTTTLVITDSSHPMAAGLAEGEHAYCTVAVQQHWGVPPANGDSVAIAPGEFDPPRGVLYAIEEGTEVETGGEEPFVHPGRRVMAGFIGNTGAESFTDEGVKLFDAAIEWLLPNIKPPEPLEFNAPTLADGEVTISWAGTGILQEAAVLGGEWTDSGNQANPQSRAADGAMFFRLRQP